MESNYLRLFPGEEGYRFFLLNAPPKKVPEVISVLRESLNDYGFHAQLAEARLAEFHKVAANAIKLLCS